MRQLLFFVLLITACTNTNKQEQIKNDGNKPGEAIGTTPRADTLQAARVILIDTCKSPLTIAVPAKPGKVINYMGKSLSLTPPAQKDADFYTHMSTYTAEQGLYSAINSIKRDRVGNLWFGTSGGGVSQYDGKSFTTYTTAQGLANNMVTSIAEDKAGNLWFGTNGGGVSRYDGRSFTNFTTDQGLAGNSVMSITEDKTGNIWFGTSGGGVSRYDGKSFTTYTTAQGLADNRVFSIAEDKTGNLWFGTSGGGVSRYDGKAFTTFTTAEGLAGNVVFSIAPDKKGNLWFGTSGHGVSQYDGKAFTNYTTAQGLAGNRVYSIAEDKAGNLWFGTYSGGVSRYDGKAFTTFTTDQGLANNQVWSIAEDNTGNIWFGTYGGGASRYDGRSFTTYTTDQGLADNSVMSIAEDRTGNLWFGTYGGGVTRYDGRSFTTYTTAQGLANNVVMSITEDRTGNIWFGTYGGGVSRYDGRYFTNYTTAQGLANNVVMSITEDRTGNLWFGTSGGGVSRYDGRYFTNYTTAQGLANNQVWSIAEDKTGNIWFGTYGGGVSRYDGRSFTNYTTDQGLANNSVMSIAKDKTGNIWLGTNGGGVSRYDGRSFTTYTTAQGLANNVVMSIAEDKTGNIWFGTNEGFSALRSFTAAGLSDERNNIPPDNNLSNVNITGKYTPVFEKYNFRNGYPVKDVNTNAMLIDSKGIIWAGTGDKLVRFDYSGIYKDTTPPHVFINAITIGGENVGWYDLLSKKAEGKAASEDSMAVINEEVGTFGEVLTAAKRDSMQQEFSGVRFDSITRFYPIPVNLVLPYRHNHITFDFGAVEVARPYLVNYRYMLEGYDIGWNPVTNRNTASFGNIHEGTYSFKLKAQNPDGVWSEPVEYTFTVLPPWYRTWWIYAIYIMLMLAGLRMYNMWRVSRLQAENQKLEEIVEERTKEIADEKKKSDNLLLNILPEEVADDLKERGATTAHQFDHVTVIFTDFVAFTQAGERMGSKALVEELHNCFKAFDDIIERYGIEKIKTIGDAYLAVCGLPVIDKRHAEKVVQAAQEIRAFMLQRREQLGNKTFEVRIGIHSGEVVAGIVGVKKFAYDIWGDTVNTAARMESNSEPGKINISQTTYELVKDKFNCVYRGEVEAKGKGKLKMYFVEEDRQA